MYFYHSNGIFHDDSRRRFVSFRTFASRSLAGSAAVGIRSANYPATIRCTPCRMGPGERLMESRNRDRLPTQIPRRLPHDPLVHRSLRNPRLNRRRHRHGRPPRARLGDVRRRLGVIRKLRPSPETPYRASSTASPAISRCRHSRSVVIAGTPSRIARAMQGRSPRTRPVRRAILRRPWPAPARLPDAAPPETPRSVDH